MIRDPGLIALKPGVATRGRFDGSNDGRIGMMLTSGGGDRGQSPEHDGERRRHRDGC